MKSIFDENAYQEILERISCLDPESKGLWGKMNIAQMLHHCQHPLAIALERKTLKKPNFLMKLLLKGFKASMYNDKPWKPSSPTPKEFRVNSKKDFTEEKSQLLSMIADFHEKKNRSSWNPHPAFGHFSHEQWGQMQYKHLDHHLRQFGV